MELERRSSKPEVVRSSRTEAFLLVVNGKWKVVNAKFFLLLTTFYLPFTTIFRGRLMAGRRILAPEIKVQILSPKPIFILFLSARSLMVSGACFGNKIMGVQIFPRRPIFFKVFLRRRSPIGRGGSFRNCSVWVRLSPSVFVIFLSKWRNVETHKVRCGFVRTRLVRVEIPSSTPI